MGRTVFTPDGVPLTNVPDGMSDQQAMQKAGFMAAAELEQAGPPPPEESAEDYAEWAKGVGPVLGGLMASRQFVVDRLPDNVKQGSAFKPASDASMQALRQEYPKATFAGDIGFPIAASFLGPSKILPQAGIAGGLEYAREDSTLGSTGMAMATAGGFTAVGNALPKIGGAIADRVSGKITEATRMAQTMGQRSGSKLGQWLEGGIDKMGGFEFLKAATQKTLNRAAGKAMGLVDDIAELTPKVFDRAAKATGKVFQDAADSVTSVDTSKILAQADELGPKLGSKARSILGKGDDALAEINGQQYINLRSALTKQADRLMEQDVVAADAVEAIINSLDDSFESVAPEMSRASLRVARERWKNMRSLMKAPEVRNAGNLTARQANQRLSMAYDDTFDMMRTDHLLPETKDLMDVVRAAEKSRFGQPNSGSPTGNAQIAGLGIAGYSALTGDFETAGTVLALSLAPQIAGRLNVGAATAMSGAAVPALEKLGAGLGQAAAANNEQE